jgi:DNA-binding NarL/FixJ family response regulator
LPSEPPLSDLSRSPVTAGAVRRLLIADDMQEFCALLRETFVPPDGFEVIGEAHDGQEAVTLAQQLTPPPDVVILDIDMPRLTGPEAAQMIRKGLPGACIFLMSAFDQDEFSDVAKSVGANGYIPKKSMTPECLARAIQELAAPHQAPGAPTVSG